MDEPIMTKLLYSLNARLDLPGKYRKAMLRDFKLAAERLMSGGLTAKEAANRLDPARLGNFYLQKPDYWFPLDDAAKIYPMSMTDGWMSVFRLSAYLDRPVEPELLRAALHFTMPDYPFFATRVRRGLFWHYIDAAKRCFEVRPERELPCSPMDISRDDAQSFRVVYYKNRISVEFFHILTDGTGGLGFLTALLTEYLRISGELERPVTTARTRPDGEECENAFERCARGLCTEGSGFSERPALQLRGKLAKQRPARLLHMELDAEKLKEAARSRDATVTALVLAFMTEAAHRAVDGAEGRIQIQVPVNMRRFCPSKTQRNFSMYCTVSIENSRAADAEKILPEIGAQLAENASEDAMKAMLARTASMVRALANVPLAVKRPAARLAYGVLGERAFTSTLSNLGVAKLPEDVAKHVEKLDFVLGTGEQSRAACAMVTLGNSAMLTVTKLTEDRSFEDALAGLFRKASIPFKLGGSMLYGA